MPYVRVPSSTAGYRQVRARRAPTNAGFVRAAPPPRNAGFVVSHPPRNAGFVLARPPSRNAGFVQVHPPHRTPLGGPGYPRHGYAVGNPLAVPDMSGLDSVLADLISSRYAPPVQDVPDLSSIDAYIAQALANRAPADPRQFHDWIPARGPHAF